MIYQGCSRKFVFRRSERGCKQKYNSAWGTECAGRGAGPCRYIGYAVPCVRHPVCGVRVLTHMYIYAMAWRTAVRPAATAFQWLPKPKPISYTPISLLSSLFTSVLALSPCCPTLYPLYSAPISSLSSQPTPPPSPSTTAAPLIRILAARFSSQRETQLSSLSSISFHPFLPSEHHDDLTCHDLSTNFSRDRFRPCCVLSRVTSIFILLTPLSNITFHLLRKT